MFKILQKENLAKDIKKMVIEAPQVAQKALAGQFVMIMPEQRGERIPLTLADFSAQQKTITLIFQEVGFTTQKLGSLKAGGEIYSILGPLGKPTKVGNFGCVVCIGGGVGIAEIYPVSRAFKQAGNEVIGIIGARSKELVILEKEMKSTSSQLYITTDDGSYAQKGLVTDILEDILEKIVNPTLPRGEYATEVKKGYPIRKYGEENIMVYAIGPVPMMAAVCELTRPFKIKTVVSLNPIMVDATGMCGSCRVKVGGQTYFACVDGPDFDGHLVDFKELKQRLGLFKEQEQECQRKKCPRRRL